MVTGLNSKNSEEKGEIPFELGYIGRLNGVSFQELRARGRIVQIASAKCHAKSYYATEGSQFESNPIRVFFLKRKGVSDA